MKTSISRKPRTLHTPTPRVSALHAALSATLFTFPMLFAAAPVGAVQFTVTNLGTLGGTYSEANGINAAGQVVGSANTSGNAAYHAFLRGAQGSMTDLNALLVAGSGATVTAATGVNDLGQIVGNAFIAGQTRAVLLTPGGSLAWLGSGAGGSFADGANWELGFSPSKFLDAVIASAGSQTIYASVDATVNSLSLGGAMGSSGRPRLVNGDFQHCHYQSVVASLATENWHFTSGDLKTARTNALSAARIKTMRWMRPIWF